MYWGFAALSLAGITEVKTLSDPSVLKELAKHRGREMFIAYSKAKRSKLRQERHVVTTPEQRCRSYGAWSLLLMGL